MRKLFHFAVMAAIVVAMTVTSCSTGEKANRNEKSIAEKIEGATSQDSIRMYVDEAKTYVEGLIKKGDIKTAQAYIDSIRPVIEKKVPSMSSVVASMKVSVAEAQAKEAAAKLTDSISSVASEKAKELKDNVSDAADKASDKVSEAAGKAADKVSDVAGKAADALKGKK